MPSTIIKCNSLYPCFFKNCNDECRAINLKCGYQSKIIDINSDYKQKKNKVTFMECSNCVNLDKDYDENHLTFPMKRCNKNVITFKELNIIYSINKKCDFFKLKK